VLARWALYHLSHTSGLFCSGYFGDRVSLLAQVSLDRDPPILCFLLLLGWQAQTTTPSFFLLRWGLAIFFAQVGLKPQSSWSQPPVQLEWQVWATGSQLWLRFLMLEVRFAFSEALCEWSLTAGPLWVGLSLNIMDFEIYPYRGWFLVMTDYYSIVWIYDNLFTHSWSLVLLVSFLIFRISHQCLSFLSTRS
jgi:hypothetical protein